MPAFRLLTAAFGTAPGWAFALLLTDLALVFGAAAGLAGVLSAGTGRLPGRLLLTRLAVGLSIGPGSTLSLLLIAVIGGTGRILRL